MRPPVDGGLVVTSDSVPFLARTYRATGTRRKGPMRKGLGVETAGTGTGGEDMTTALAEFGHTTATTP
jgi:hypothetical protein